MDQVGEERLSLLVVSVRHRLLLHGVLVGRLRLLDQPDPAARVGPDDHRQVQPPNLCGLLDGSACSVLAMYR